MFSNGKFKNVVADVYESYQIKAGESYRKEYSLLPLKGKRTAKRIMLKCRNNNNVIETGHHTYTMIATQCDAYILLHDSYHLHAQ